MTASDDFDQTIKVKAPGSGTMVFNRYRLDRILGRGGMGVVWLAMDTKLEREVALKFLPSLVGIDSAAVKELKTETRRGLELSHPHIIRIYDFVDDEEAAAISMEFIEGQTLSDLRLTRDPVVFTTDEVAEILPGVCDALDYAHFQRKIVHRDLKPANIMVTKDKVAKIADFGISRSISDTMSRLSMSQMGISGTLPYMSPQQAMGDRPSPADDVYSLGATIYELLSGKPPFFRGDIATQITSKIPARMEERREELEIKASDRIPKEWEEVIAACLQKDPSLRPPSAGKLLELLGLKSGTTSGTKTSFPGTAGPPGSAKPAPRNRMPVYAAAAAVVVLGAGAAMYFQGGSKPAAPVEPIAEKVPAAPETPAKPAADPVPTAAPESTQAPAVAETPPPAPTPAPMPAQAPAATAPSAPTAMVADAPAATPPPTAETAPAPPVPAGPQPAAATPPAPAGGPQMALVESPPTTVIAGVPNPSMIQPPVTEPPSGSWPIEMLFPTPPQASYSENGRRKLLFKVQGLLKEKALYNSTQDGKEGKGTHNAIVLFQAKNGLVPNGLLDGPTLTAMALMTEVDDPQWKTAASGSGGSSSRKKSSTKNEPNMLQRAGKSIGRFFGRD
ncbi:MAG: protein kinase [Verrucomicrobiaceae bacterium]|nr:protein kinase [Verrucomicrobiaceae bacterium]